MEPIRLKTEGTAAARIGAVESVLRSVPGVLGVHAEPGGGEIKVTGAESVDPETLIEAARNAGFTLTLVG